jgi:hypothetical protein
MSDKQSIPKGLQGFEMLKFLGLTQEDFKSADKLNSKLFPSMSEAYKKAGGTNITNMGPSGTFMLTVLIKFYQDIYSKMEEKDILDEIIIQFLQDNYGDKSPLASLQFWLIKPEHLLESVNILRGALKINKFSFADFNSQPAPSQEDEDLSTFEPQRFGKKLGNYIGISFGVSLLICFMLFTPSLVMNHFIYKSLFMRLVLGFYSSFLFIFLLPYYIFLGIVDPAKSPKKHALLPLRPYFVMNGQLINNYTWEISKSLFGIDSYLPTLYDGNDTDILYQQTWLKSTPHEKDLKPIAVTLESIVGKPLLAVS